MATSQLAQPALREHTPQVESFLPLLRLDFSNARTALTDGLALWVVEKIVIDLATRTEGSIEGVNFDDYFKGKRLWQVLGSDFSISSWEHMVKELRGLGRHGEQLFADKITDELRRRGHLETRGLQYSFDEQDMLDMVFWFALK